MQASNTYFYLDGSLFFHDISLDSDEIIFENDSFSVENIILDHTINCSGLFFKEKNLKRKLKKILLKNIIFLIIKLMQLKMGLIG